MLFGVKDNSDVVILHSSSIKTIVTKPNITIEELAKVVGLGTSRISTILKELKKLNRIKRARSDKTGYSIVNNLLLLIILSDNILKVIKNRVQFICFYIFFVV